MGLVIGLSLLLYAAIVFSPCIYVVVQNEFFAIVLCTGPVGKQYLCNTNQSFCFCYKACDVFYVLKYDLFRNVLKIKCKMSLLVFVNNAILWCDLIEVNSIIVKP
jgi:hypothetical protein